MKTTMIMHSFGLAVVVASSVWGQTGDPAKLISVKKCAMCHKKEDKGNQYGTWQSMKHSTAYELLGTEEAKAVGAKLGIDDPQSSGQCLKCHSTAYFFTEELQTTEVSLGNGVSCQSCHGPGADYKKKSIMKSLEESMANGMVHPAKEKSCTRCHNDTGPTWDPERYTLPNGEKTGFDVVQAYEKIKHERPSE